ncbi:MAG: YafY family transcriptional regulator [Archangiaceae bacterium]|nr:YafY family transcriptional regulator [Archangiaceae bacterium]
MRRAERLFEIIQVLRRAKGPMTAQAIADTLEMGRRTLYRDIAALIARRVPIRGEAGVGYVLERGFDMPPLMLTPTEIEAVVLGSQWVVANGDAQLSAAAVDVLAKVAAIVPTRLRDLVDDPVVGTPPPRGRRTAGAVDVAALRDWARREQKLALRYADEAGTVTERTVWPVLIGYVTSTRVLIAWCELRRDFRVFLIDRMLAVRFLDERYPERRVALRRRWLAENEQRKARRQR